MTATNDTQWPEAVRRALETHEIVLVTSGLSDTREAEALLDEFRPGRWTRLEWGMGSAENREAFHQLQQATGMRMLPLVVTRDGALGGLPELRAHLGSGAGAGSNPVAAAAGPDAAPDPGARDPALSILGAGGLIPFVFFGAGAWIAHPEWQAFALNALALYGAVILAFLGAIHWGLYLADRRHRVGPLSAPGWAVIPSVLAWLAVLQPLPEALMTLAVLFLVVLWVDRYSLRGRRLPQGYLTLRMVLTTGAILSLAAGLGSVMVG